MKRQTFSIRHKYLIRMGFFVLAAFALGGIVLLFSDVVRAALDQPNTIKPYDPLANW